MEQNDYLKNVELARVLDKRRKVKEEKESKAEVGEQAHTGDKRSFDEATDKTHREPKRKRATKPQYNSTAQLDSVLSNIF